MPAETITFPPNIPVTLTLADPDPKAEHYDFETQQGRFTASDGRILVLPRQAAIKLNELGVQPGEEIGICKYASGKKGELPTWAIWLTPKTEQARSKAVEAIRTSGEPIQCSDKGQPPKPAVAPPIDITRPQKRQTRKKATNPDQGRLFNRGTGTYGPAPQPALIPLVANGRHRTPPARTHYAVALNQMVEVVKTTLQASGEQWNDGAKQDLVSTLFIQAAKDGRIVFEFPESNAGAES